MNETGKLDTTATDGVYQGARPASRVEPAATPNAIALARQFPPREPGADWPATRQPGAQVVMRLLGEPGLHRNLPHLIERHTMLSPVFGDVADLERHRGRRWPRRRRDERRSRTAVFSLTSPEPRRHAQL